MANQYVLGIDHGTGGCKVTCINESGKRISEAYVAYPSYYSQPRWVEQNPEEWMDAAIIAVNKALKGFSKEDRLCIKGIGFSAPHHVAVLLDEQNQVIRKAIMWNDQRSGEEVQELIASHGDEIIELTNHRPSPTWTLPQILWLKKNEPENYKKIKKVLFEKDYIRYRFTGEMMTDNIEAEGSMFYDVKRQEWSEKLLSLIGLNASMLPEVKKPTDGAGTLMKAMADKLNLSPGIPVIIGTADTASEIYGSGATQEGDGVIKLATAGNFSVLSANAHTNMNLTGYHFPIEGLYYLNSATNFAAASFRWLKETFFEDWEDKYGEDDVYSMIDKAIATTKPGADGLLFHPYLNGERSPYWDPYLRASFFGAMAGHTRIHFARAVLEGVAFSIKDASLEFGELPINNVRLIGGGSKSKVWSQIMADILNLPLESPRISDSSYGTALITGTALQIFPDLTEASKYNNEIIHRVEPIQENVIHYEKMFDIYKEYSLKTKELSHRLSDLYY